jgi:multiple sugar transport system substrate-binding protein
MKAKHTARATVALIAALMVVGLTACTTGAPTETSGPTEEEIQAALDTESTLTIWSFSTNVVEIAKAFEAEYPKITVKVENVGSAADTYTKLQNAITAGSGGPDIVTIEYHTLPQFALTDGLADLTELGLDKHKDLFEPSVWANVNIDGGLYELPRGFGPMALFYNKDVFDQYGVEAPTTWDEYYEAAKTIHEANPQAYIAADTGDANLTNSLIWASGGVPYAVDGTELTIDLADEGTSKYTEMWSRLMDEGLHAPIPMWSTEWYQGLTDGTIASVAGGAWLVSVIESGFPDSAGAWRVAELPSFDADAPTSALNGGGGDAILEQSENKLVAAAFLEFMSTGPGIAISNEMGFYPATVADISSPEYLGLEREFFGNQHINEVFLESAKNVNPEWQFLPFNAYAGSIFAETVGGAYLGEKTLEEGLLSWQDELSAFGEEQGFTVVK